MPWFAPTLAPMITRRRFTAAAGAALALPLSALHAAEPGPPSADETFSRIESAIGGRLGIAVLDTGSGRRLAHRADERFPLCSTFKLLAAAAVLARVDAGHEQLERRIAYTAADLVAYSPETKARVGEGAMPLADICEAAITQSDNTAGNLMLAQIGGPAGLTASLRASGDAETRLDRIEPDLNEALPGDPRDTTTPSAMLTDLDRFALGETLSAGSRDRLKGWLLGNRTGDTRLRAGLPPGWRVGDKTGTGDRGTANDVAILFPPAAAPILAAVYLTGTTGTAEQRNAAIAEVGRLIAARFGGSWDEAR